MAPAFSTFYTFSAVIPVDKREQVLKPYINKENEGKPRDAGCDQAECNTMGTLANSPHHRTYKARWYKREKKLTRVNHF